MTNIINTVNNNTVSEIIVAGQPVMMAVITPKGEILEINSPDGEQYFLIDPQSRIGTSIDIRVFEDCKVLSFEYGEPLVPEPTIPAVVVDTYEYHGKKAGKYTDAFLVQETREDGEASALIVAQSAKNKQVFLTTADELDYESGLYTQSVGYTTDYFSSYKQEEKSLGVTRESADGFFAEEVSASSFTATRVKSTEFTAEIYRESEWQEDTWYSFDSLHATKEVKTSATTKWTSMEAVRQYSNDSSSEYLWYSYDESTNSKRIINAFEVFIDEDAEFGLSVYIEGDFNTWKYTGSGSEKEVEVYASYYDGGYEQTFVITEENSRRGKVMEVTRAYDGIFAVENVTTTVTDYRKDTEKTSVSSSIRYLDEDYAYGDFLDGVEFYTGHDVFKDIMKFESESLGLVDSLQNESWKLGADATELALTKGTQTQQYLER